jgi:hypothetical protein
MQALIRSGKELEGTDSSRVAKRWRYEVSCLILLELGLLAKWPLTGKCGRDLKQKSILENRREAP